ncbi:YbjQ family protein [Candidatus Woesearchaeota archaeon]|jgi:uncharacterized protein YbjQ (UPF0145 family)|nr:YbjQ family protein [Candidatus Woesearchaeota archaeon]
MIVTNTSDIPGKKIKKILGIVKGTTVRSKHIGKDIGASLKSLVGGELKSYTNMLSQAREEANNRMVNEAIKMDADAIINVRFMTSAVTQAAAELLVYGTAVKLK